jgi:hypothetical protein
MVCISVIRYHKSNIVQGEAEMKYGHPVEHIQVNTEFVG